MYYVRIKAETVLAEGGRVDPSTRDVLVVDAVLDENGRICDANARTAGWWGRIGSDDFFPFVICKDEQKAYKAYFQCFELDQGESSSEYQGRIDLFPDRIFVGRDFLLSWDGRTWRGRVSEIIDMLRRQDFVPI